LPGPGAGSAAAVRPTVRLRRTLARLAGQFVGPPGRFLYSPPLRGRRAPRPPDGVRPAHTTGGLAGESGVPLKCIYSHFFENGLFKSRENAPGKDFTVGAEAV